MKQVFPYYLDKTLDAFEASNPSQEKALAITWGYISDLPGMKATGKGLTFVGQNGVGKTHLACNVMAAAGQAGFKIECIELSTYIDLHLEMFRVNGRLREGFDEDSERSFYLDDQLRYIKRVQFLLLDDLGREHESASGWSNERIFDLLRYRHNRNLPTLITTNIPVDNPDAETDLNRRYTEGLSSFLQEATIIVEIEGEDYRWRGAS